METAKEACWLRCICVGCEKPRRSVQFPYLSYEFSKKHTRVCLSKADVEWLVAIREAEVVRVLFRILERW